MPAGSKYVMRNDTYCTPHTIRLSNLQHAKRKCDLNPECKMFYELRGENKGYILCTPQSNIKHSAYQSRLYIKDDGENPGSNRELFYKNSISMLLFCESN